MAILLPYLEQEAAARQKATLKQNAAKAPVTQISESRSKPNEGTAAAVAAATVGTNRQYVAEAKKLSEEDPEEFERVKAGAAFPDHALLFRLK